MRVQPVHVDAQLVDAGQDLGGERFVHLDHVDVLELHPGLSKDGSHRPHRAHTHVLRLKTDHRGGDDPGHG